jgi:hypothetical protein
MSEILVKNILTDFQKLSDFIRESCLANEELLQKNALHNNWFIPNYTRYALEQWAQALSAESIASWLSDYQNQIPVVRAKKVGIVMAGNIPLVGFHDLICVLASGHIAHIKPSSNDQFLIKILIQQLCTINPQWQSKIKLVEKLNEIDVVIATGSNNSSRYFYQYFSHIPHIIRHNRTSIAVLSGTESIAQIKNLGKDVFTYFGLGCRNVSKLYVPQDFHVSQVYDYWEEYAYHLDNHKYKNNYDYQRSILLLNKVTFFDNGFLVMRETTDLFAPIGVLYFERYQSIAQLSLSLEASRSSIQAISSDTAEIQGKLPLGTLQMPQMNDYADGVDTLDFLAGI